MLMHCVLQYGDIDFYPNLDKVGGVQPGCEVPILDSIDCSHQRAPVSLKSENKYIHKTIDIYANTQVYMSESINSEVGFLALECASRSDFEV